MYTAKNDGNPFAADRAALDQDRRNAGVDGRTVMSPRPSSTGLDSARNRMMGIYVLGLLGIPTGGLSSIGAVIWAYIERGTTDDPYVVSHCANTIRVFWISLGLGLLFMVLTMVVVGMIGLIALPFWHLYRNIKGLVYASKGWAYDRPNVVMA